MHKAFNTVLIAAMAFSQGTAIAGQGAERERSALARLAAEIDLLEPLVASAERQAGHEARFAFDYDALRSTLNSMTRRIDLYLETQQRQPRNLVADTDG